LSGGALVLFVESFHQANNEKNGDHKDEQNTDHLVIVVHVYASSPSPSS
jgi:hypothetical protein